MKVIKIFLILNLIFFFSCQHEENEILNNNVESLSSNSQLVSLIERVTQNVTSNDNVLDNSSCFSVQLPVTVIVNNQQITVNNASDYQIVQDAIDQFSNDDDIINFIYPITIQFQNFQTQIIDSIDELDDVIDQCGDDDGFDEIDCIQVVYPIIINMYDSNNQLAQSITIINNSQFFNLLNGFSNNQIYAIQYPINVVNANGQVLSIQNNSQFMEFIDDSIDDCSNSGSGGNNGSSNFNSILTTGNWHVSYYFDDTDQTAYFNGYNFIFNINNSISVMKNGIVINGDWNSFIDSSNILKLDLSFDGNEFDDIEEDWQVIEYTNTIIRLKDVSGGNGGTDYLTFTKN